MSHVTVVYIAFVRRAIGRVARPGCWSLATQLLCGQLTIVVVVIGSAVLAAYLQISSANRHAAEDKVRAVAYTVAAAPTVRTALVTADPTTVLEPLAEQVQRDTGTSFVVVMSTRGVRYTHPDQAEIGGRYLGHIDAAVRGGSVVETYTGTLGPSVRAVVPVEAQGRVVGLVAVGVGVATVSQAMLRYLVPVLGAGVVSLALAALGCWLAMRWLRRSTRDLGPADLRRMNEFYDAVLHSVREGVLLLDGQNRLQLFNAEARRLLALPADARGRRVADIGLPQRLGQTLTDGLTHTDELHLTDERIVVVNQAPARRDGRRLGTVVTLRDHTELLELTDELRSARDFADSLHAQAHEAANQMHTVIALIEMGRSEHALRFATAELATTQQLTDLVVGAVHEPEVAALILGKAAEARERGVDLVLADDTRLPAGVADPRDLITIIGNLVDNALDAASSAPAPRWVHLGARVVDDPDAGPAARWVELRVADSGPGLPADDVAHATERGWSTKPARRVGARGLGLALADRAVQRYGGRLDITRETGAVFTVRLPFRESIGEADDSQRSAAARVGAGGGTD